MPMVACLRYYGAEVERLTVTIKTLGLFSSARLLATYVTLAKNSQASALNLNFYIYELKANIS